MLLISDKDIHWTLSHSSTTNRLMREGTSLALGVSHVMRYINLRYLLTYLLTFTSLAGLSNVTLLLLILVVLVLALQLLIFV